jgi:hypothetical protein
MFPEIDNPEFLICEVNPKSSFLGSFSVRVWILTARSIAFCHTGISSKDLYSIFRWIECIVNWVLGYKLFLSLSLDLSIFSQPHP